MGTHRISVACSGSTYWMAIYEAKEKLREVLGEDIPIISEEEIHETEVPFWIIEDVYLSHREEENQYRVMQKFVDGEVYFERITDKAELFEREEF